jgi:hypothetical protein
MRLADVTAIMGCSGGEVTASTFVQFTAAQRYDDCSTVDEYESGTR